MTNQKTCYILVQTKKNDKKRGVIVMTTNKCNICGKTIKELETTHKIVSSYHSRTAGLFPVSHFPETVSIFDACTSCAVRINKSKKGG